MTWETQVHITGVEGGRLGEDYLSNTIVQLAVLGYVELITHELHHLVATHVW